MDTNATNATAPQYCNFNSFHTSYKQVHGYSSLAVCSCGILMNTINIVVLTRKEMRSPTNLILTGLALADLLQMFEYIPFAYLLYIDTNSNFTYEMAHFVLIHANVSQIFHTISTALTVILALWRYVAIAWPYLMRSWYDLKTTQTVIFFAYVGGFLICTPFYFVYKVQLQKSSNNTELYTVGQSDLATRYPMLETIVVFWVYGVLLKLVPCLLLTFLSIRIVYALIQKEERRRKLGTHSERKRISDRTTRMLLTVLLLFLITEFPQAVLGFMIAQKGRDFLLQCYHKVADLVDMLTLSNASINFVLYCSMSRQFRMTFRSLFCRGNSEKNSNFINEQANHTLITNV